MNPLGPSPIVFSEWLPTGVMVHFEGGASVFFSAQFLYEEREVQANQMFRTDEPFTSGELWGETADNDARRAWLNGRRHHD
jgi:hypothetical protein